ncbi:tetratricopeptide repeat protein [Kibdelosporangium aridum]|nr:tetratricopeptide repeat protein [Kibdelosporangium aridum]
MVGRWRSSWWWLLAAVLATVVVAPAVVKALGVEDWRWLAATAVIAGGLVTPWAKIQADKIGRRVQRREDEAHALSGSALGRGSLRVRDVDDPTKLGVHPAKLPESKSLGQESKDAAGPASRVPVYVPRDGHTEIVSHLGPGSFVLLVGDSTAGKSRLAYEAMLTTLPNHHLVVPDGRTALGVSIAAAVEKTASVLWLDDLERFLGVEGLTMSMIDRMRDTKGHRVIVATIRREELNRLQDQGKETPELGNDVRRILSQAHHITVERLLTPAEIDRASALTWDPRIADAIEHADEYGLAEYLAAGPELLARWENGWAPGTHPRGAALVAAAIDCRRAGWTDSLPIALLEETHQFYLDQRGGQRLRPESLEAAFEWAHSPLFATTAMLEHRDEGKVHVADYLVDHVQRTRTADDHVPDLLVHAAIEAADGATVATIGSTMYVHGRFDLAGTAFVKATTVLQEELGAEHPNTLTSRNNLALVLHDQGDLAGAETEHRAVLQIRTRTLGTEHPNALTSRNNLALVLHDQGDLAGAETEHRAVLQIRTRTLGTEHPDTLTSRNNLATVLRARGDLAAAETEHRAELEICARVLGAEHPDTLISRNNLALVLQDQGDLDSAEAELRAVLDGRTRVLGPNHPDTLRSANDLEQVQRARRDSEQ